MIHRTVLNNPFEPGSGAVPTIWVGRTDELTDVRERAVPRRLAGLFERGRTFLGDPGMGKSVLVNRLVDERRTAGDLVAAPLRLARGRDPLAALSQAVEPLVGSGERAGTAVMSALDRVREVGLLGARVSVDSAPDDRYASLARLLGELALTALEQDQLLVLQVDEVQNVTGDALSQLLTILGDLLEAVTNRTDVTGQPVKDYLPVLVLLSGLPTFPERAAAAGATFSRRFATTYLEPFGDDEVRAALTFEFGEGYPVLGTSGPATVFMARGAIEEIIRACQGDPFLFQLAGAAAWDAAPDANITQGHAQAGWQRVQREVQASIRGRLAGLTELQLAVLASTALLGQGEHDGTIIAQGVGRARSSEIGSTLQALATKHLLRLTPNGYRVVSRALARHLREVG